MAVIKYSRQREAIINFLRSRKDHPTAEVIYQNLKINQPNLSLGTVYRNLTLLSETGIILKISCNDSSDHFDGNVAPHGHFICKSCHCIKDLTINTLNLNCVLEENEFHGKIENSQVLFYGICENCIDS